MPVKNLASLLVIALVAVCVYLILGLAESAAQDAQAPARLQWDYKVQTSSSRSESTLDRLGREGWELIAVVQDESGLDYYLKRQLSP